MNIDDIVDWDVNSNSFSEDGRNVIERVDSNVDDELRSSDNEVFEL